MDPLSIRSILFILFVCLFVSGPVRAAAPQTFTLFHPISLYAEPSTDSPMVIKVKEGTNILFQSRERGWLKIVFSGEMTAWVADCFLKDGIYTENVIFRLGPTAAASVLTVKRGSAGKKAEITGKDASGYWNKVRLKSDFTGFIQQSDLEKSIKQLPDTHRIKHLPIISTAVGRLLPLDKPYLQATHKLVYNVNDAEYLVAYVIPEKVNLKLWENWVIYISGESIWVPSVFTPFMKGANIFPAYR